MTDQNEKATDRGNVGRMVFDGVLAIVVAATGWYVSGIAAKLERLDSADVEIRASAAARAERLPLEYVRKDEYRADINEIKRLLENIDRKVDRKQDRPVERVGPGVYRDGRDINR
jgi:tetrahydromethanopterin S-methyltransferase subunit G